MKKYLFHIIIIALFLNSCTGEGTTNIKVFIVNQTTHNIEIRKYFNGNLIVNDIITLLPGSSKQIGESSEKGLSGRSGFVSSITSEVDSLQIFFNNTFRVSHYIKTPLFLSPKHHLSSSLRNIMFHLSYNYESEDVSKTFRRNTYTYSFTNDDYLFASR